MSKAKVNVDSIHGVLVINARYAKELLRLGYHIVDIKPDRANKQRTVFIFKDEGNIREDLEEVIEKDKKGGDYL